MISQVYLSYRPEDEDAVAVITLHLLQCGIVALPMDAELPTRNIQVLVVVIGDLGLTPAQLSDVEKAVDDSSVIAVALLGDTELPDAAPPQIGSAPSVRLDLGETVADDSWKHELGHVGPFGFGKSVSKYEGAGNNTRFKPLVDLLQREMYSADDEDDEGEFYSHQPRGESANIQETVSPAAPTSSSEVFLGVASQQHVYADSEFVARFSAYTEEFRETVAEVFEKEAPTAKPALDLHSTRWKIGTKVTVSLSARGLNVDNSPQQFEWNGKWSMLRFDVEVPPNRSPGTVALKFNVIIEGITVAALRPEIEVHSVKPTGSKPSPISNEEQRFPKTAFASYSTDDRAIVLNRVRSLQIFTDIDVFVDCLSIRPAQRWRDELAEQLLSRELFLLFWSRNAAESKWVDWEWRKILKTKGLDAVQPHPLEPAELAPPPPELADLQFGTAYETFMVSCNSNEDE